MDDKRATQRLAGEALAMPRSLWAATAKPPPATEALRGEAKADVAIVGGGYTGLSAALHLAERGAAVTVLEAAEIGWGASGRNNGQVIPGLKLDPDEVERRLGREAGGRLIDWAGAAPAMVFALVARHGLDCGAVNRGWIQPAYSENALRTIERRCRQWAARGAPVEMLDAAALPDMLGTPVYRGAWLDRRGGAIHPLDYARGLAAAALRAGAVIHTRSLALSISRMGGRWRVETPAGSLAAGTLILATNAYTGDLLPGLRRSVVPVRTVQAATRPLPPARRATILPGGQAASDTRRLLASFRLSPDGRLVMGGAGATAGAHSAALERKLHRAAAAMFGHLGPLDWEFGWSCYLAITADHLPHLHEPAPGLHIGLGYNGRGIAVATAMGRVLAERVADRREDAPEIPVTPVRPVAFHAFRRLGVALATAGKGMRDGIERRRSRPSR